VLRAFGISVAVITAMAMLLTLNSIRIREQRKGIDFNTALGIKFVRLNKESLLQLALLGIGLNFAVSGVLNILPSGISASYTQSYKVITDGGLFGTIVVMAVVTPILEEIFFRGVFQRKLSEKLGASVGLVSAATIFGLMHFNIIWSTYSAILGFFLGCVYLYYDSVLPGAIVHCMFNLVSCLPLAVSSYKTLYKYTFGNKIYVVVTMIVGFYIIYKIVDKTWIKAYFNREFYGLTPKDEVEEDENI
jgi:membrane protease YdiL (CAAX protease family)